MAPDALSVVRLTCEVRGVARLARLRVTTSTITSAFPKSAVGSSARSVCSLATRGTKVRPASCTSSCGSRSRSVPNPRSGASDALRSPPISSLTRSQGMIRLIETMSARPLSSAFFESIAQPIANLSRLKMTSPARSHSGSSRRTTRPRKRPAKAAAKMDWHMKSVPAAVNTAATSARGRRHVTTIRPSNTSGIPTHWATRQA
mmetsp:Transcript_11861/g.28040  ORF Transcript_11861/g.28040 Transcript_11861/m.28040 type:complete len:203 (+) Transcript_11861:651-1259(+)